MTLLTTLKAQVRAFVTEETGSEVAQAAGVAIFATAVIGAMSGVTGPVVNAVRTAFQNLAGAT